MSSKPEIDAPSGGPAAEEATLRLRPGRSVFEIAADQLQISFPNYTATFTGVPVVKGVRALLAALEGGGRRDDVARRAASQADLDPQFVHYLIDLLETNACLYRHSEGADRAPAGGDLATFLASVGEDPEAALSALSARRPLSVTPASAAGEWTRALEDGGMRADVLPVAAGIACGAILTRIRASLEVPPPVLVVWGFSYRSPFARLVNDLAFERRIPILFGACEGVVGRIGPYVIPRSSACLECLNSRWLSHTGAAEMRAFAEYRSRNQDLVPEPAPVHPLFQGAVARLMALELSRILTKIPPKTIGGVVEYQFSDGSMHRHPVHRVPRCGGCHSPRPQRNAWDVKLAAPMIKGGNE